MCDLSSFFYLFLHMFLLDVSVHTLLKLFFIQHHIAAFTLNRQVYNEKEMIFVKKYIYIM